MGGRKRKLSAAEKAAKKKRREEFETIFVKGKMKRVRRPLMVEGMSVDDFIRANADPIFFHQEELWEYMDMDDQRRPETGHRSVRTPSGREQVSFITVDDGMDLVIAFAVVLDAPGEIASLILQRTPRYESLLPQEERGVMVSHELYHEEDCELLREIVVNGTQVDVDSTARTYQLDISAVESEEVAAAKDVLSMMHKHGRFQLAIFD